MFSSPFTSLSKNQELRLTLALLFVVMMCTLGLRYLDQFLINDTCTGGIISFELARDIETAGSYLNSWGEIMEDMGIENKDEIVIYDNSDVISSCRCWYNLIYFGHDPKLVHVLDGGFKKWKKENKTTNNNEVITKTSVYSCKENAELVKNKKQIDENINKKEFNVVDARSRERFEGKVAEPRKGLRSGSIKNSFCLPFNELINDDHTFVNKDKISERFKSLNFDYSKNLVFSCGSGVTASVLALAYSIINDKYMPTIYDGSWSEYGKI